MNPMITIEILYDIFGKQEDIIQRNPQFGESYKGVDIPPLSILFAPLVRFLFAFGLLAIGMFGHIHTA